MGKMDQEILAVSADYASGITDAALKNGGFASFDRSDQYRELLQHSITKKRGLLEEDPAFKQIIPYLVLVHENRVFYYARAGNISEKRLARKVSIGLGGHVELEDIAHVDETIMAGVIREVEEEIGVKLKPGNIAPLGFIYTEGSIVDEVHLGILMVGKVTSSEVKVNPEEIGQYGYATSQEMEAMLQSGEYEFENWTRIAWQSAQPLLGLR